MGSGVDRCFPNWNRVVPRRIVIPGYSQESGDQSLVRYKMVKMMEGTYCEGRNLLGRKGRVSPWVVSRGTLR